MKLLETWNAWRPRRRDSRILQADESVLKRLVEWREPVRWSSWEACAQSYNPWSDETPLHLGLDPLPFVGDVKGSRVCFLLLNPGLCELDYFAEYRVRAFARRLRANLRQDFRNTEYPFFPLDPNLSWHSGNRYWQNKLAPVIDELVMQTGRTHADVRKIVAQNVCALELVPYHSVANSVTGTVRRDLPSAQMVRQYVQEVLLPDARAGRRLVVAMRSTKDWGINRSSPNVLRFQGGEALGARLSTAKRSSHGSKVVEALLPLFRPVARAKSKLRAAS